MKEEIGSNRNKSLKPTSTDLIFSGYGEYKRESLRSPAAICETALQMHYLEFLFLVIINAMVPTVTLQITTR